MATQVYLLRHGETAWSHSGQHTGRTDLPLTENGERRASVLRGLLQGVTFTHVLTSPLQRARRTCELAGLRPIAREEPDLQEWDYGDYEGRTTAEIRTVHPAWNLFVDGCPRGESVADISRRADQVVAALRRLDGRVAVFSHGHFLCALAVRWIGQAVGEGRHFVLDTAAVSILGYERAGSETPAITLWNRSADTALGMR